MIQEEMVFALGFVVAGLLALACLPAVWKRAMRLTTRRLAQLVPLSMDEIVAERDALRAGFAVEQRRLEQKLEALDAARSELMVELGRRDVRVAALEDKGAETARRVADLTAELGATTRDLHDVRGETGAAAVALHDLTGLAERRRWEVLASEEKARTLQSTIDEGRATVAALETRVFGLDTRVGDLDRLAGNLRGELDRTVQAYGRAMAERDAARKIAEELGAERDRLLAGQQGAAPSRLGEVAEAPPSSAEAVSAMPAPPSRAVGAPTAEAMRGMREALESQLAMQAEAGRAAAAELRALRAENAALQERLTTLQAAPPTPAPVSEADLAVVRDAIRRVSDDVLRLVEQTRDGQATPPAGIVEAALPAELSLPN